MYHDSCSIYIPLKAHLLNCATSLPKEAHDWHYSMLIQRMRYNVMCACIIHFNIVRNFSSVSMLCHNYMQALVFMIKKSYLKVTIICRYIFLRFLVKTPFASTKFCNSYAEMVQGRQILMLYTIIVHIAQ